MTEIDEVDEKEDNGYELISKKEWKQDKQLNDLRMLVKKSNDRLPNYKEGAHFEAKAQTLIDKAKKDSSSSITPEMI